MIDRIKKVKALVLDVDGVLTDGKIIFESKGKDTKNFDVQDGFAIVLFKRAGFKTPIITARSSRVVTRRAKDLHIDKVYQNAFPKIKSFQKMLGDLKLKDEDVCFIGDDLPDLQVLRRAGFAVAVANAAQEIKKNVHYVTQKKGGEGAIREVVELILKGQGKWPEIVAKYA